ncbi:MAG: maleylpyruvate isomerase N-terminal domain-containing protein [Mycobacteriales bacterium]
MIAPDTKDWTWVLQRSCDECGYDAAAVTRQQIGPMIRANADSWGHVELAAQRPDEHTWSPLEYACHVRDVLILYRERLDLMTTRDDPLYPNWNQDETAVADNYAAQDPIAVRRQLCEAAAAIANRFDALTPDQWHRPGRRSDGAAFTIDTFSRYFLHDVVHHLHDVSGG